MVLKLYGFPLSTCTRRVALVCKEKEIPYELVPVDLQKGEHKNPAYTQFQPFGQVPYIDDDGFILFESRAIGRYLAKKFASQGTPLIPTDPKSEALFEQAASIETANFDPYASLITFEKVFKKRRGLQADEKRVEEALGILNAKLDAYEAILSKQKYLAGNEVTLADLFHLPYGSMFSIMQIDVFDKRPNVARWWKEISSRPSWLAVKDGA